MAYVDRVQALANNSICVYQVENKRLQSLSLSYMTVKEKSNNSTNPVPIVKPTYTFHKIKINNMTTNYSLELTVIPYAVN